MGWCGPEIMCCPGWSCGEGGPTRSDESDENVTESAGAVGEDGADDVDVDPDGEERRTGVGN